jgi:hypothetical protein
MASTNLFGLRLIVPLLGMIAFGYLNDAIFPEFFDIRGVESITILVSAYIGKRDPEAVE